MKKGMARAVAFCLTAGLTFSGSVVAAYAAAGDATLIGVGTSSRAVARAAETEAPQAEAAQTEAAGTEAPQTEAPQTELDRTMVGTTGFAQCDGQINVRASGDTDGEILGVLNNKNAVQIEDVDENGWYKIKSGNLEGYVAGQFIATGSEADQVAQTAGYTSAEVGAEVLNIRADKSTDSDVVATAAQSDSLEVVQDDGDWLKVCIDNDTYGWVSCDYVHATTQYSMGETLSEESERVAAEREAAAAEQADSYAAVESQDVTQEAAESQDTAGESQDVAQTQQAPEADSSETDSLYQAYLDAQEAAMHPTDEADAQAKADAAVAAYQAYLGSLGVSAQETGTASAGPVSETAPAQTAETAPVNTDADSLYQAYLQAQDAANHPTDEADAQAKADAAVAAYNAYLNALGSGSTSAAADSQTTQQETSAPETTAEVQTPETSAPEETSSSDLGAQIASYATQFVGNPYVYGGSSLTGGADCSGFTMAVFSHFGIGLPHNAAAQSGCGRQVSLSDIQPGDLLFYDNGGGIGHVTIYIGNGQVCHASNERTGITISSISYRNPVCAVRAW